MTNIQKYSFFQGYFKDFSCYYVLTSDFFSAPYDSYKLLLVYLQYETQEPQIPFGVSNWQVLSTLGFLKVTKQQESPKL